MELKKRFNIRKVLIFTYFVSFGIYLFIGFMPAEASNAEISSELSIPKIDLISGVVSVELNDGRLDTPDTLVGSYSSGDNNMFLFGHSSTVFSNLDQMRLGDSIEYNHEKYTIVRIDMVPKSAIDMGEVLSSRQKKTITVMTCAGKYLGGGDATHRLILTAVIND